MGTSKGIRWPDDLAGKIEEARKLDRRKDFSDEVFYLVELGLEEAAWCRDVVNEAKETRSRGRMDGRINPKESSAR
jgi:hypothetical protein